MLEAIQVFLLVKKVKWSFAYTLSTNDCGMTLLETCPTFGHFLDRDDGKLHSKFLGCNTFTLLPSTGRYYATGRPNDLAKDGGGMFNGGADEKRGGGEEDVGGEGMSRERERDSGTCPVVDMFYSRRFLLSLRAQPPSKIDHHRAPFQPVRRLTMYNLTVYLPVRTRGVHSNRGGRCRFSLNFPSRILRPIDRNTFLFLRVIARLLPLHVMTLDWCAYTYRFACCGTPTGSNEKSGRRKSFIVIRQSVC